jgi:hypothetical protein
MAYKQTLGEAFSKPYESVTRAGGNLSRSRMNNTRTSQMPEQLGLRAQAIQSRIGLIQHQMRMAEQRMNLMGQGQNEKAREFDINDAFRNKALDQKGVGNSRWDPQYLKSLQSAYDAADKAGASNPDGTIDFAKLRQNPKLYQIYKDGIANAGKTSHTAQQINRGTNAKIMEQTMQVLDPRKLTESFKHYSGPSGEAKYLLDVVNSQRGKPMPKYFSDYQAFKGMLPMLVKQASQFWGTSIQEGTQEQIKHLLSQDNPLLDWRQRSQNVNNVFDLLKTEGATLQDMSIDPADMEASDENQERLGKINDITLSPGDDEETLMGKSGKIYTQEIIQNLMDQHGATREEVIDILRRKG